MSSQPYSIRDDPEYGRIHSLIPPTSTVPRGDSVTHSYTPPDDPDTARGHAFNAAVGAFIGSVFLGVALAAIAVTVANKAGWTWTGVSGALAAGFFLPFVWPFPWVWRSPARAYRKCLDDREAVALGYHGAIIERLRHRPPVTAPAYATPHIERTAPDAGMMFYLQCAAVLARATLDPRAPRNAREKIQTTTDDGVLVVVTKDEYDSVAGMLCELGFMTGGEGQKPRAYALAPAWQGKSVEQLWAGLKAHRATIKDKVSA